MTEPSDIKEHVLRQLRRIQVKNNIGVTSASLVARVEDGTQSQGGAAHTPGPWELRTYQSGTISVLMRSWPVDNQWGSGHLAASVDAFNIAGQDEKAIQAERYANALLIAAAPEMLEALKAFIAAVDRCIEHDDASLVDEITDEIEQLARKAIAKAQGRSQ